MEHALQLLETLRTGTPTMCHDVLTEFNTKNEKARKIDCMTASEKEDLWSVVFERLGNPKENESIINPLLNTLRILSREKDVLEDVMTAPRVECVLRCAGLEQKLESIQKTAVDAQESLNGLKVIFNMVFQSEKLQQMYISAGILKSLVQRVQPNEETPMEVQYFLLKTFFIITALSKGSGAVVRNDLNGIGVLADYIDTVGSADIPYDNSTADVLCEALKVLFTIIHDIQPHEMVLKADMYDSKTFTLLCKVCRLVRRNLLHNAVSSNKKNDLDNHSVHLLTAVPYECYVELLTEDADDNTEWERVMFEGTNMCAIESIVKLLELKLNSQDSAPAEPILVVMYKMASKDRKIRRYLKQRILPPLTKQDIIQRPEVGSSIRNKLCAIIHNSKGNLSEVSINLLFILCKENVETLIKYTGYGNAAGLLADRGLLLGGKGDNHYSDESGESDTEEYKEARDKIHEIEGWIKPEDARVEMTEEQKEYEALKLVETIEKLSKSKIIQPCRIGQDGKPQPIQHVLELQEAVESSMKSPSRLTGSDSDSD